MTTILRLQINDTASIVPNWITVGQPLIFNTREGLDDYIEREDKRDRTLSGLLASSNRKRRWWIRTVTIDNEEFRSAA